METRLTEELIASGRFVVLFPLQGHWTAVLWLHLVAKWSKCHWKWRTVLCLARIWFSAKLSYTSVGNLYWWLDVCSARQPVPGCTEQKHGTGSGGTTDQQRWDTWPAPRQTAFLPLILTSLERRLWLLSIRAQMLLLLWRVVRHCTCCSLCVHGYQCFTGYFLPFLCLHSWSCRLPVAAWHLYTEELSRERAAVICQTAVLPLKLLSHLPLHREHRPYLLSNITSISQHFKLYCHCTEYFSIWFVRYMYGRYGNVFVKYATVCIKDLMLWFRWIRIKALTYAHV